MKKTKRILSLLLAVILVAGLITPTVLAETTSVTTGVTPQTGGGQATVTTGTAPQTEGGENADTPEPVTQTWDFTVGSWGSGTMADSNAASINAKFEESGWSYIGSKVAGNKLRRYENPAQVRISSTSKGSWAAVKIKAPSAGTGVYTLSMEHGVSLDYGASKANVYVLPGSVADAANEVANAANVAAVENAIAAAQAVGSINFDRGYNGASALNFVDSQIGTFDFTGEDTYIVVFQAEIPNDDRDYGYYMFLGELTLTQGDVMRDDNDDSSGPVFNAPAVNVDSMVYDFYYAGEVSEDKRLFTDMTYGKYALDQKFAAGTFNWTPIAATGRAVNARYLKSRLGIQVQANVGDWFAVKLQSPGTGTYNVVLDLALHVGNSKKADVYIVPASLGESKDRIEAAIANNTYKLPSSVNFKDGKATVSLGFWDFVSGEDCLIVFKAIADKGGVTSIRYDADGVMYSANLGLRKILLTRKNYDVGVYNFVQNGYIGKNVTDTLESGETIFAELSNKYGAYAINWKVENMATLAPVSFTNNGLVMNGDDSDWLALRVQLPSTGSYAFKLDYLADSMGADVANVYLVKAAAGMTQDEIQAQMTTENMLGTVSFNGSGAKSVEIGVGINLTSTDYLVIFEVYQGSDKGAKMQLGKLSVTPKITVEYNFDLADSQKGIAGFGGKRIREKLAEIEELYKNGTLNWSVYDAYSTRGDYAKDALMGADFKQIYGLRHMADIDSWYAYTIKSPGNGTFSLSLDHAVFEYGTSECAIYIIEKPAAGTDLKALVNKKVLDEEPFASVNMFGVDLIDGINTYLGTYNFKADKEYLVIFYTMGPRAGYANGVGYMMFSHLIAVEGNVGAKENDTIAPLNLGESIFEVGMRGKIGLAEIDGVEYYYLPIKGGKLLVYNLETLEKVAEVTTGIENAWSCEVDSEGTCYVAGDAKYFFKYNVVTGLKETLYHSTAYACVYDIEIQDNGVFYFAHRGAESGGGIGKYDPATKEFTWYKKLDPNGIAYTCDGVAYKDGYLYAVVHGSYLDADGNQIWVIDLVKLKEDTGEIVTRVDLNPYTECRDPEKYSNSKELNYLTIVGDMLIGGDTYLNHFICFDVNTMEYLDLGIIMGSAGEVSEVRDGKAYCILYGGGLVEIDVEAKTASYVQGFSAAGIPFRCHSKTWVTMNHSDLPGASLFTCSTADKGGPRIYNLEKKTTVSFPELTKGEGGSFSVKSVYASNDGSGLIFCGGYVCDMASAYDTKNDRWAYEFVSSGQSDSFYMYDGELYVGGYSTGALGRVNLESGSTEILMMMNVDPTDYDQTRIHCITGGDGKIFFGTVPDVGLLGGCLVIYDIENYDYLVLEDFVNDQIILNMFYKDGLLFGSTSVSAGVNGHPVEKVSKIFVYDVKNNVKLGEFVVDIDGVSKDAIPYIAALNIDMNGKMWGVISETLFSFTYDRKTNTMSFTEELSFSKTNYSAAGNPGWFGRALIFFEDSIYYSFPSAGFRRISLADPKKSEIVCGAKPIHYAIGEDGNLYYSNETELMMYPLKYDDSDWAVAKKVDQMVAALETQVTPSNASKVQAALKAYNELSDEQKCLVQNYSRLTTLNRRLVVALIESLPAEITLADLPLVEEARAQYEALEASKRRFVTNIGVLEAAETTIGKLKYLAKSEEAAALVIQHINNIPAEITMAAAGKINIARTTYEALTDYQKTLVTNYQKLVDAEAALAVLVTAQNQGYADKIIAQIDALGTISLRSEKAIMMARLAYETLTPEQKLLVSNYQKLLDAEAELARLKVEGDANVKAVEAVEALIKQIGDEITLDSVDVIAAARKAYDALTDFQKTLVNNYDVLIEAETLLAELEAEQQKMIITVVTIVVVAVVLVAGAVTLFAIPATRAKILGLFEKKSKTEAE